MQMILVYTCDLYQFMPNLSFLEGSLLIQNMELSNARPYWSNATTTRRVHKMQKKRGGGLRQVEKPRL